MLFNPLLKFSKYFIKVGKYTKSINFLIVLFIYLKSLFNFQINWLEYLKNLEQSILKWKLNNNLISLEVYNNLLKKNIQRKYLKKKYTNKKLNYLIINNLNQIKIENLLLSKGIYYINPLFILQTTFENFRPILNMFNKVVYGKIQKIPIILNNDQSFILLFKWFKNLLNKSYSAKYSLRYLTNMENLLYEFLLLYFSKSYLIKVKKEFYDLILKNRVLLRFLK